VQWACIAAAHLLQWYRDGLYTPEAVGHNGQRAFLQLLNRSAQVGQIGEMGASIAAAHLQFLGTGGAVWCNGLFWQLLSAHLKLSSTVRAECCSWRVRQLLQDGKVSLAGFALTQEPVIILFIKTFTILFNVLFIRRTLHTY
jgi:hypothetical protein